jgi:hypothetical protein
MKGELINIFVSVSLKIETWFDDCGSEQSDWYMEYREIARRGGNSRRKIHQPDFEESESAFVSKWT